MRRSHQSSSDLTDAQWAILEPLLPKPKTAGRLIRVKRQEIANTILDVLRTGCQWRYFPSGFRLGTPCTGRWYVAR